MSRLTEQFQRPLLRRIIDLYSIDTPLQLLRRIVPYLSGVETIPASPQRIQAIERIERALRKPELLADLVTASARSAAAVLHTQSQVEDRLVTNLRATTLAAALKPVHFANLYVLSSLSDAEVAEYAAFLESDDAQWMQGIIQSELMNGAGAVGTALATGMSSLPKPPVMPPPGVARGTDPETLYTLGVQLIDAGNETDALRFLNDAIRIRPDYAIAWYKRGNAWRNLNQMAKSIDDYTQAIRLDSSMAFAYFNRGVRYRDSDRFEPALADFNRALEIEPSNSRFWFNRAFVNFRTNRKLQAIGDVIQAIRLDPLEAGAWSLRGEIHGKLDEWKRALQDCEIGIALSTVPADKAAGYTSAGLVLTQMKDYRGAISELNHAVQLAPTSAEIFRHRGWALEAIGQNEDALRDYDWSLKIESGDAWTHCHRAAVLDKLGRPAEANADRPYCAASRIASR